MNKAVFLDRDGVINVDKNYVYKIEDFEFIDGVFESLTYLQNLGYKLFIITNQSGIGRDYYTKDDFYILMEYVLKKFKEKNIEISQVEFCPHNPDLNCNCRKPNTGMIENILAKHAIDLENSWLIGDKNSDIMCAKNAKIKYNIQVKSSQHFDEKNSIAMYQCDSIKHIKDIIKK